MSVHKIASNHYKNRPKTNLEQIITPILGPDKTVTPERANLDQQENMIRKGRREERTKIKQGRKSITAENPKPTKHYKNSGLRQLSRTPRLEHRKQSIFEKAATKIGFWGQDRIHYVYSGFVRFCPTTTNRKSMVGKGGPGKRPVFFFLAAQKLSEPLFGGDPILSQEPRFQKALCQKTLFLSRNSRKGSKNRRQNREWRHDETRPNTTFPALFSLKKAPCPERLRAPKTISRQTRFDNWSLQGSDETLRKPVFLDNEDSRPHFRTHRRPHYRTHESKNPAPLPKPTAYIYIYIQGVSLTLNPKCDALGSFFFGNLILSAIL